MAGTIGVVYAVAIPVGGVGKVVSPRTSTTFRIQLPAGFDSQGGNVRVRRAHAHGRPWPPGGGPPTPGDADASARILRGGGSLHP